MLGIEIKNVSKSYDGKEYAVENLNLSIAPGAFLCLLGPSGCGKTTTLRMIAGLEHVDSGTLLIDDKPVDAPGEGVFVQPEKRKLGLVFQSYALWPHMTVEENVAFGLRMKGASKEERVSKVQESLKLLQIAQYGSRYPAELSGGQQQRVALARMLAVEPDVLLLDEPLSNLDAALRLEMRSELKQLHNRLGNTIVFVTHDQLEAMSLATDIAVMNAGKLEQYGPPMEVYRKPRTEFVAKFVGSPPMNMINVNGAESSEWRQALLDAAARFRGVEDKTDIRAIGFRPEVAEIVNSQEESSQPRDTWVQEVVVEAVLPTGPESIVSLGLDQEKLYLLAEPDIEFSGNETATLRVPLQGLHVFDSAGLEVGVQELGTVATV